MSTPTLMRILIVDDHALVRDGIRALLSNVPDMVVVGDASEAAEALNLTALCAPTLVLMDVGMRGINGLELTDRLLAQHPDVLVLMLSMFDDPEYAHRAKKAGARGYVLKDAPSSTILAAIRALHANETAFYAPHLASSTPRSSQSTWTLALDGDIDAQANETARNPSVAELSDRERAILQRLALGHSSKQIAAAFDLSVRTVETHRQNIRRKLKIAGQAELIRFACQNFGSGQGSGSA